MDENLERKLQESESEWANIEKQRAEREKKDRKIISEFCANNKKADIFQILLLLEKYDGMPDHDKDVVMEFKNNYPGNINTKQLYNFLDVKDIYSKYLESGGNINE